MDAGGCEMIGALLVSLALQGQPTLLTSEPPSIVAALTHETVEIREDFSGQELVLYGATRGMTIQDEIVVVLRGPARDLRVMEKQRTFGIWINSIDSDRMIANCSNLFRSL